MTFRSYTRRVLARDTLKIAIVGDIDAETAGELLDRTFGALPAKAELDAGRFHRSAGPWPPRRHPVSTCRRRW